MDLLELYRGGLSIRRLGVLVRQLPADSALVRAINGGRPLWGVEAHLLADLWALKANPDPTKKFEDHPVRAEMEAQARMKASRGRIAELRAISERRKRTHGSGVTE